MLTFYVLNPSFLEFIIFLFFRNMHDAREYSSTAIIKSQPSSTCTRIQAAPKLNHSSRSSSSNRLSVQTTADLTSVYY